MLEGLLVAGLLLALFAVVYYFRRRASHQLALRLLDVRHPVEDEEIPQRYVAELIRPFARRHRILPWFPALAAAAILWFVFAWPLIFVVTFSILVGLLLNQLDAYLLQRRMDLIENQLADAIGLLIAAVHVGASLQAALENALRESRPPLRPVLDEVVGRIRYGDDPVEVMRGLRQRVPLETFNLFATALAVNWRVGGSIAATLAKVESTIRDRLETTRRIRAMTVQSRVSVISVLLTTYFIAALIWRNSPERMSSFLATGWGQVLAALAVGLQGIGVVWISWLSKPRF